MTSRIKCVSRIRGVYGWVWVGFGQT